MEEINHQDFVFESIDDFIIDESNDDSQLITENNEFVIILGNNKPENDPIQTEELSEVITGEYNSLENNETVIHLPNGNVVIWKLVDVHSDPSIVNENNLQIDDLQYEEAQNYENIIQEDDINIIKNGIDEINEDDIVYNDFDHNIIDSTNNLKDTKLKIKNDKKYFLCTEENCNKMFTTSYLKTHQRWHLNKKKQFICQYCEKTFIRAFALKNHIRVHTNERPFGCTFDNCVKAFKTSSDLLKHKRIHNGERQYKCKVPNCNKSFTTNEIRKMHINTHLNYRPYICSFDGCEKKFINKTNLQNHENIHLGIKPFKCEICTKSFTEYSSLYKHKKVHLVKQHCKYKTE